MGDKGQLKRIKYPLLLVFQIFFWGRTGFHIGGYSGNVFDNRVFYGQFLRTFIIAEFPACVFGILALCRKTFGKPVYRDSFRREERRKNLRKCLKAVDFCAILAKLM